LGLGVSLVAVRNSAFMTLRLGGSTLPGVEAVAVVNTNLGGSGLPFVEGVVDRDLGRVFLPDVEMAVFTDLGESGLSAVEGMIDTDLCFPSTGAVVGTDLDRSGLPDVEAVADNVSKSCLSNVEVVFDADLGRSALPGIEKVVTTDSGENCLPGAEVLLNTDFGGSGLPGVKVMVDTDLCASGLATVKAWVAMDLDGSCSPRIDVGIEIDVKGTTDAVLGGILLPVSAYITSEFLDASGEASHVADIVLSFKEDPKPAIRDEAAANRSKLSHAKAGSGSSAETSSDVGTPESTASLFESVLPSARESSEELTSGKDVKTSSSAVDSVPPGTMVDTVFSSSSSAAVAAVASAITVEKDSFVSLPREIISTSATGCFDASRSLPSSSILDNNELCALLNLFARGNLPLVLLVGETSAGDELGFLEVPDNPVLCSNCPSTTSSGLSSSLFSS